MHPFTPKGRKKTVHLQGYQNFTIKSHERKLKEDWKEEKGSKKKKEKSANWK